MNTARALAHDARSRFASLSGLDRFISHPAVIFLAAAAVRVAIVLVLQLHQEPFRAELRRTAESLATTGAYANPYLIPTGPTAHVSPAHTSLVAALFYVFGTGVQGEVAQFALNITLTGLLYAALPLLAVRLGVPRRAGVGAAWFGALVPFHFLNELRFGDAVMAALALMGILVMARPIIDGNVAGPRQWVRRGLLWGLSALLLPSLLGVIAAVIAIGFWTQRTWSYVGNVCLAAIVAIAVLSPWALRNRTALGEMVWFRSNFGIELRVSYNDFSWSDAERTHIGGARELYHPLSSLEAARRVAQEGELTYNRRLVRDAVDWIDNHRRRAFSLFLQRIVDFWFPPAIRIYQTLLLSALSLLAFAAVPTLLREYRRAGILLLVTWASFPLMYYVMQSAVRYRYPMMWTILLAGAVLLVPRSRAAIGAGRRDRLQPVPASRKRRVDSQ